MKRDLELVRKMILAIEDHPSGWAPHDLAFEGYTRAQAGYHAYLLIDSGLAKGEHFGTFGSEASEGAIDFLTRKGHEFAAAARDDTRRKKAEGLITEKGGNVTIDILTPVLGNLMRGAFGL